MYCPNFLHEQGQIWWRHGIPRVTVLLQQHQYIERSNLKITLMNLCYLLCNVVEDRFFFNCYYHGSCINPDWLALNQ